MGHINFKNCLAGLIVTLVVLSVSMPFSVGILSTMGKIAPLDMGHMGDSNSNDWMQNRSYSSDSRNWSDSVDGMCYEHNLSRSTSQMDREVNDMMNESMNKDMFGQLSANGSHLEGGFVRCDFNQTDGSYENYTVVHSGLSTKVFDSVDCMGLVPNSITKVGSVMKVTGTSVDITMHNNPTAMMKYVLNGTNQMVHFICNDSWSVGYDNRSGYHDGMVTMTKGNLTGMIIVDKGTLKIEKINNKTMAMATKGQVSFLTGNPDLANAVDDNKIMQSIASGKIAGQLSMVMRNGSVMTEEQEYEDATMRVSSNSAGHVEIEVNSSSSNAKVMEFVVDTQSLNTTSDKIVALLNGAKIARMSLDQVLAMNGTGNADAKFVVIDQVKNWKVLVYIPHFSTQVVGLEVDTSSAAGTSQSPGSSGSTDLLLITAIAAIVVIAIVVVLAVFMLRRSKK
ncbi:MAG TPA: hypothetical protein VGK23_03290 [Methanomassiliicoccales archaeon]|jgi:hypothetical protein